MHEVALAQELVRTIDRVARENGARRVITADLMVGELTCVEPEALSFAFGLARRGTLAEGCELRFDRVALEVACAACGYEGPADHQLGCPRCQQVPVEVTRGREFRLLSIDVDDEDPPEE